MQAISEAQAVGYHAYWNCEGCPFDSGTRERAEWLTGFLQALRESDDLAPLPMLVLDDISAAERVAQVWSFDQ